MFGKTYSFQYLKYLLISDREERYSDILKFIFGDKENMWILECMHYFLFHDYCIPGCIRKSIPLVHTRKKSQIFCKISQNFNLILVTESKGVLENSGLVL